jgi:hypothetical protein
MPQRKEGKPVSLHPMTFKDAIKRMLSTPTRDDLMRYRDAGVDELVMITLKPPSAEDEAVANLERIAREWVEPAAAL